MRIGVISDTHENMPKIASAVKILNSENVELTIHCGDIISPITYSQFSNLKSKMICIFGNNDGDRDFLKEKFKGLAAFHDSPFAIELDGKKFLIMHEPYHLADFIDSGNYDFILYGHTHEATMSEHGRTLVLNPGEAGTWLTGKSTMALIDSQRREVRFIDIP